MLAELVILIALHADDKNEAEQLFRKMETKLTSAKSVEFTYGVKVEGDLQPNEPSTVKGSLALAEGNKSRLEANWKSHYKDGTLNEEGQFNLICDGEKFAPADKDHAGPAPKWLNGAYRAALTRCGLFVQHLRTNVRTGEPPKEFKADDELKVSDFKLGKKEKVGDQEGQAVQYKLKTTSILTRVEDPLTVTVWIDTKTNVPLKREVIVKTDDAKMTITETYTKWSIAEKIDPKKFELPKD